MGYIDKVQRERRPSFYFTKTFKEAFGHKATTGFAVELVISLLTEKNIQQIEKISTLGLCCVQQQLIIKGLMGTHQMNVCHLKDEEELNLLLLLYPEEVHNVFKVEDL